MRRLRFGKEYHSTASASPADAPKRRYANPPRKRKRTVKISICKLAAIYFPILFIRRSNDSLPIMIVSLFPIKAAKCFRDSLPASRTPFL